MASDSETAQSQIRSIFERLVSSRNRDLSLFLPFLFGLQGSDTGESIVLINPFTQGMVVIEEASLSGSDPQKSGQPPASKSSIDSLPTSLIGEGEVGECAICLEDWEFGSTRVVKEMPCNHKFHGDCLEKWLRIHGSCPVCRFQMPVDHEMNKTGGERSAVWLGFNLARSSSADADADADNDAAADLID